MRQRIRTLPESPFASSPGPLRRAFTVVEILVSMTILITGIVAIVSFFPSSLRQNQFAIDKSIAAYLAQLKAEELRRDNDAGGALVTAIKEMQVESPPLTFPFDRRFAYSFSGLSLPDPADPTNPAGNHSVAQVVVRYSRDYRPSQETLYRLVFE